MEKKKRDLSIDIAKGLLGIFVIFGHLFGGIPGVQAVMHPLLLPSFFMLSGLMIRLTKETEKPFSMIALKRTTGILVPYIFFEIIGILIYYLVNGYRIPIREMIWNSMTMRCNNSPDWFLYILFFAQLFVIAVLKRIGRSKHVKLYERVFAIVTVLALLGVVGIGTEENWKKEILVRFIIGSGFIMTGYIFSDFIRKPNKALGISAFVLFIAAALTIGHFLPGGYRYDNPFMGVEYGPFGLYYALAIIAMYGVIQICKLFSCKPLSYLGEGSLILMGTHLPMLSIIRLAFGIGDMNTGLRLLLWILLCALEFPVCWFIRNYMPFLTGKGFFTKLYARIDERRQNNA